MLNRRTKQRNPYDGSSLFSRLFMTWIFPILRLGYKRDLKQEDVYECCREDDPVFWADQLER